MSSPQLVLKMQLRKKPQLAFNKAGLNLPPYTILGKDLQYLYLAESLRQVTSVQTMYVMYVQHTLHET